MVWTMIYILSAVSLAHFISEGKEKSLFYLLLGLYLFNGIVNVAWSYFFFTKQLIGLAVIDAGFIWLTTGLLIYAVRRISLLSAILLIPYFFWVSFAWFLNFVIYKMN
jgi:tryptophan-rich sensory protein